VNPRKVQVWEVTTTKLVPLIFSIPAFLVVNPWYPLLKGFDLGQLYFGLLMSVAGLFFLYETLLTVPTIQKKGAGQLAVMILAFLTIGSFAFGLSIIFQMYHVNPNATNDTLHTIMSIILGLAVIMYIVMGREELFHHRRLRDAILAS